MNSFLDLSRTEHQNQHWDTHKKTCYDRYTRKIKNGPPTAMDAAVKYILQLHDSAMVDIGTLALMREDPFVDLKSALEECAVVVMVQQTKREEFEEMEVAHQAGRIPPFELSRRPEDVVVAPLGDLCQALDLGRSSFENPVDRQVSSSSSMGWSPMPFETFLRLNFMDSPCRALSVDFIFYYAHMKVVYLYFTYRLVALVETSVFQSFSCPWDVQLAFMHPSCRLEHGR